MELVAITIKGAPFLLLAHARQNRRVSRQIQSSLFDDVPDAGILLSTPEGQYFDRKSFRIEPKALGDAMLGFANAEGGRIVIGIHSGVIEGVNGDERQLNALLQAAVDYTESPVRHSTQFIDCIDVRGLDNRLLVLDIEASESVHRNKRGECFYRVGDENRKLRSPEERELVYDKGDSHYDQTIAEDLGFSDLDTEAIRTYAEKMGSQDEMRLLRARGLYLDKANRRGVTHAGWLVLGREAPIWSYWSAPRKVVQSKL